MDTLLLFIGMGAVWLLLVILGVAFFRGARTR